MIIAVHGGRSRYWAGTREILLIGVTVTAAPPCSYTVQELTDYTVIYSASQFTHTQLYSPSKAATIKKIKKIKRSEINHCTIRQTQQDNTITGSAVALHCCKAHAKINTKIENSTPCKIVTHEDFNLKLGTRDYVGDTTHHATLGPNRPSRGFPPNRGNITPV